MIQAALLDSLPFSWPWSCKTRRNSGREAAPPTLFISYSICVMFSFPSEAVKIKCVFFLRVAETPRPEQGRPWLWGLYDMVAMPIGQIFDEYDT